VRDYVTAVDWFKRAAEKGYSAAQTNLGAMYSRGLGVSRNHASAVKWYRLAAAKGNLSAQFNLGAKYANGEGVPQDYARAHMWWNIAASLGNQTAAQNRENIKIKMTPAQLQMARELAVECVAKKYKNC
jgi:hypothetical protein